MKIRSLVVDDNVVYREALLTLLDYIPQIEVVSTCTNAFEAREVLLNTNFDLVFLDIEMPGLSGVDLIKSLAVHPQFIFITSHPGFAVDSYELEAVDFILKPVTLPRLMKAVSKAELLIRLHSEIGVQEKLDAGDDHFFVKENNGYTKLFNADILYIESMGNFSSIFLTDGGKKITLVSLKNAEQQLPATDFIRISKTHIINLKKITAIKNGAVVLGKISFAAGKTYYDKVMEEVVGKKIINRFVQ